jgi:CHASE2 domain-containing sensor protein
MVPDPQAARPSSLPSYLAVAALALAGLAFHLSQWGREASLAMLDAGFGALRAMSPKEAPDDILVVGVDHGGAVSPEVDAAGPALRRLPEVLVRVARGQPRAVALLQPLPRASLEASVPGMDDALATALAVTQAAAPLAIGIQVGAGGEVIPIHDPLLRGVDTRSLAFTLLPRDEDGVVRRTVPGLPTRQGNWPTVAGWMCEVLEGRCGEGLVDWALGPAYRHVPAGRLLDIRDDDALARLLKGRVVFVAPVSRPDDRVPQPLSLAGWEPPTSEPPAVLAHAQAVRTLLHGSAIQEAPLPAMLLAVAATALVALAAAPVAPAVATLALGGTVAGALIALRQGWYIPLAAPLATLLAAFFVSLVRARSRKRVTQPGS